MIIAKRNLSIKSKDQIFDVIINIYLPDKIDNDWICRYEINWPTGKRSSYAVGLDSVQAIELALQKIGIDLYMSDYHANAQLCWQKSGQGYGFPVPKNGRDFLIGEDKQFYA